MNLLLEVLAFIFAAIIASFLIRNNDEDEPEQDTTIHVRIEEINNMYYAWEGMKFLFQNADPKAMLDEIMKTFPNKRIEVTTNKELAWLAELKNTTLN